MEDVTGTGGGMADFRAEAGEGAHHFRQAENRDGVAGGHIVDACHFRREGGMFEGGGDVFDINKIPGLVAFAENGEGVPARAASINLGTAAA